jgi:hypothetical protein
MFADTTANEDVFQFFTSLRHNVFIQLLEINIFESVYIVIALEAMNGHQCVRKLELINCNLSTLLTEADVIDSFEISRLSTRQRHRFRWTNFRKCNTSIW